jgi:hypothetical protein
VRQHFLTVTATDSAGKQAIGTIAMGVQAVQTGAVQPQATAALSFTNAFEKQTLIISFSIDATPATLVRNAVDGTDGCYVELTVYRPSGQVYGTYRVEDSIDITIANAEKGQWRYETTNFCPQPVNYSAQTQGSGTGMLVGRVMDAFSGQGIAGASVVCNTGGATVSLAQGYFAGVAVAGTDAAVSASVAGFMTHVKTGIVVHNGQTTHVSLSLVPEDSTAQLLPSGLSGTEILAPADAPHPPDQPLAARVANDSLELNAAFESYQQAVDIVVAMQIDYPGLADKIFLFDADNHLIPFAGVLQPWRRQVTEGLAAQILRPVPLAFLPPADYRFYSLVSADMSAMQDVELVHFKKTVGMKVPTGAIVTEIKNPASEPDPRSQPLAVKVVDGQLQLNAWFGPYQGPVNIHIGYMNPAEEIYLFKTDNTPALLGQTLWAWRQNQSGKQSGVVWNKPLSEIGAQQLTFMAMVADAAKPANHELFYFFFTIDR